MMSRMEDRSRGDPKVRQKEACPFRIMNTPRYERFPRGRLLDAGKLSQLTYTSYDRCAVRVMISFFPLYCFSMVR